LDNGNVIVAGGRALEGPFELEVEVASNPRAIARTKLVRPVTQVEAHW